MEDTKTVTPAPVLVAGAGNIGSAMARGIAASGTQVLLYNRSAGRLKAFGNLDNIETFDSIDNALSREPAMVLICVEGDAVAPLLASMAPAIRKLNPIIASCAAASTLDDLAMALGSKTKTPKLMRVLPNIAATCGESVNLIASRNMDEAEVAATCALLEATGRCFIIDESKFLPAMSLSSCGIAFALRYVRASVEAAVALGIAPKLATDICGATLASTSALLAAGEHPEALVDRVTTPGGITIRGLNAMEAAGFTPAVMAAIAAAAQSAK